MIGSATISTTRAQANELVMRAERITGSRMAAYEQVARTVGTSSGWIRKFVRGYEAKEPRATLYENIKASYDALCARIEADNRADELRLKALRGTKNAIAERAGAESPREDRTMVGGK
ncbi:MAG TPA: hypothetical protein VFS68_01940 [Candidatus Udaeobacter sp.]|nr:hypothetical protein [Candidatus Udaeobacter sp.]